MSSEAEQITALQVQVAALLNDFNETIPSLQEQIDLTSTAADDMWVILCAVLVFLMQGGFAMLEVGAVREKNVTNILFKNVVDAAIGTLLWWWLGFGFAFGETKGRFIGTSLFGMNDSSFKSTNANAVYDLSFPFFFFQWAFAATAATIVSGSMAERCKLEAYFLYTMFISMFVYPVIVHWCWGEGWLSAFGTDPSQFIFRGTKSNNFIDFAGSGVVHMVGGFSGLMGAAMLGPRINRFQNGVAVPIHGHNMVYTVLGTVLLWVGWYGFNCGSTLAIVGYSKLAGKIAVTTTISAAAAGCTSLLYCRTFLDHYDMSLICNAILAGLVGVTAGCAVVEPWGAFLIGVGSCIVYILASKFILEVLKVDDPVDASALHGCTGLWGVISVGIFGTDENAQFAGYNGSANGHHPFRSGEQFGVQIVGAVCIFVWTCLASGILFYFIDKVVGLRVDPEQEIKGLDCHHHQPCRLCWASRRNFTAVGSPAAEEARNRAVELMPA